MFFHVVGYDKVIGIEGCPPAVFALCSDAVLALTHVATYFPLGETVLLVIFQCFHTAVDVCMSHYEKDFTTLVNSAQSLNTQKSDRRNARLLGKPVAL